jgi:acyl carrier protein
MDDFKQFLQDEIANIAFTRVDFDEKIITSKLLDSISAMDLLVSIEDKIGKRIPQHLITDENFDSINIIIDTISKI